MTFFEHVYEDTYICVRYMCWYDDCVTCKTWLYSGDALNYIITLLNVRLLKC